MFSKSLSFNSSALIQTVMIWTFWLVVPSQLERVQAQQPASIESESPSWQLGISTFKGITPAESAEPGFQWPAVSDASASPAQIDPPVSTFALPSPDSDVPKMALAPPTEDGLEVFSPFEQGLSPPNDLPDANVTSPVPQEATVPSAEAIELPIIDPPTVQQAIDQADVLVEEPPLQSEVIRWYQYPVRWAEGWDSSAEFGIDGSTGNAETLAIQTGLELKRKTDQYTFAIDVDYRQASSQGDTTENNGRLNIDYDRLVGDSDWSAFGKFGLEWDAFKTFDLRVNLNSGFGYHWIRTDDATLITRFGAGASREIGSPDDDWIAEAVFGIDAERQLTKRQKLKGKLDYFPSFGRFDDFRLVADLSWEVLLDDSDNLSLKVAVNDRFDSTPQGAERNDFYYSLLLLYKF